MLQIESQIPRFDTIRKKVESRYYLVDKYLKGTFRFAYGISNDEAVFKNGTSVKSIEKIEKGDNRLKPDNIIYGIARNSYLLVNSNFYLVNYVEDGYIYLYNPLVTDVEEGDEIRLYSTEISISNEGVCTELEFLVGTTIKFKDFTYRISENDKISDIIDIMSKYSIVRNLGTTIYALGEWSSSLSYYKVYSSLPLESGFIRVNSFNYIVPGDDIVLFNEDIRANNAITIKAVEEYECYSGFEYVVATDNLLGEFKYAQLRAYPSYKSSRININNLKPSFLDICGDTVYGKDIQIIKGFKTFYSNRELTRGYQDINYLANLNTEPSDLLLSDVLEGSLEADFPSIRCVASSDGIFRMYVDSKISDLFALRFNGAYSDTKISVTDLNGNILKLGKLDDYLNTRLNKVTINIKTLPNTYVTLDTFKCVQERCTHLEYYFVCRESSNERVEVNGLHLNPIFKNYRELLAVVGRDKAGEGRVAL